jgi:hypothetical protein
MSEERELTAKMFLPPETKQLVRAIRQTCHKDGHEGHHIANALMVALVELIITFVKPEEQIKVGRSFGDLVAKNVREYRMEQLDG